MLKEIIIAIEAYFRAHRFIRKHRLWKWIILPGILYALLFCAGMFLFIKSSNKAVLYLSSLINLPNWLQQQKNDFLSFLFVMGGFTMQLVLLLFYFSLFKYGFLIIGSPLFAYLSEKTQAILGGGDAADTSTQLSKVVGRSTVTALRNALWQTVYILSLLILSLIPLVGWIIPVFMLVIECYYYGFSMLDYSCARHGLSPAQSAPYINKHRGLAIGNGLLFYCMHLVPVVGWVLAPAYAMVAAAVSLYNQQKEL
ncbi:MAG: EI24 domain-containing protein [Williamsia sp.]|nr:EI24 domain-containing protein [Williamsia sp.]